MKLKSNKNKKVLTIIGIVVLAVLLIVGATLIVSSIIQETQGKDIKDIVISGLPTKFEYYVGDEFDPKGTLVQVRTKDMKNTYFVDYTKLKFSGFDSSAVNDALTITVSYQGFTTTFDVSVKEKPVPPTTKRELVSIKLSDNFNTTYSKNDWNFFGPTLDEVDIICTFSDATEERVDMLYGYIKNPNLNLSVGTYDLIIEYTHGTKTVSTTVTITITD